MHPWQGRFSVCSQGSRFLDIQKSKEVEMSKDTQSKNPPLVAGGYLWDKTKHYNGPPRPSIVPLTVRVYKGRLWLETRL